MDRKKPGSASDKKKSESKKSSRDKDGKKRRKTTEKGSGKKEGGNHKVKDKGKVQKSKSEFASKRFKFRQGSQSSVKSHRFASERINQLSKPTKSVLLSTWQRYCDVFDYERMWKIIDKLHLEFTLTPQEKQMCWRQMKKNAMDLCEKIAMGSTEEIRRYHITTEDLQRLSRIIKRPRSVHSSRRIEELARPKPYKVLATWDEHADKLPYEQRLRFRQKYVDGLIRTQKESRKPARDVVSYDGKHLSMIEEQERLIAREAAYKLVEKGVQKAMTFAVEGRPPPPMTRTLIKLSDNILSVLSDYDCIKTPCVDTNHKDAKFLLYVADWTAKIISDAYFATEKMNVAKKSSSTKPPASRVSASDKTAKGTIPEKDEGVQVNGLKFRMKQTETQTEPKEKPFEEIPEIDNNFGNESDWDGEEGKLRDEAKSEVKKLTITNSNTEIIHIRKDEVKTPTKEVKAEVRTTKDPVSHGVGDHVDEDHSTVHTHTTSKSCEDSTEEATTDVSLS